MITLSAMVRRLCVRANEHFNRGKSKLFAARISSRQGRTNRLSASRTSLSRVVYQIVLSSIVPLYIPNSIRVQFKLDLSQTTTVREALSYSLRTTVTTHCKKLMPQWKGHLKLFAMHTTP